jgi:hypothetical protein
MDQATVRNDFEYSAAARDHLDLDVGQRCFELGGQTGRLGLVVSNGAVFDADDHGPHLQSQGQSPKNLSSRARR